MVSSASELSTVVTLLSGESMDRGLKVLHLINQPQRRGAELFAIQLAGAMASRGYGNTICSLYGSPSDDFTIPADVSFLPIAATRDGISSRLRFNPTILQRLVGLLRRRRPDVVIAHGSDTLKYVAASSVFCHEPVMLYRNIGTASFWGGGRLRATANRQFVNRMDAVVSVSEFSRLDFMRLYRVPGGKVSAIPNGVDLTPYRELDVQMARYEIRQRLGLSEKDTLLITVGSLSFEKNQGELIALVAEIKEISPHLLMVGDGRMRHELESSAREAGVDRFVHFLGVQTRVAELLAASDLFVLPSKSEGMPAALIEAGLAGLASVAYDVGGVKEVIEQDMTGVVVPAGNHGDFVASVTRLLRNAEIRRRMGDEAKRLYPGRFGMETVAAQYEGLLSGILSARRRKSYATT